MIEARIKYIKSPENSFINEITTQNELTNVSKIDDLYRVSFGNAINVLNISNFNDKDILLNKYNGIITRINSNNTGIFTEKPKFTISGSNISQIIIVFDFFTNEYATRISLYNYDESQIQYFDIIYNNICIINLIVPKDIVIIQIDQWNKPNRPCKISYISTGIEEVYNKSQISNLSLGKQTTNNATQPSFSVVGQYGGITIRDKNSLIREYMSVGLLKEETEIEIYYNSALVGTFNGKNWSHNEKDYSFRVEVNNDVSMLSKRKIPPLPFEENITADVLLNEILYYSPLELEPIDETLLNKIRNIVLETKFTSEERSLLATLNMWCNLTQTSMFINKSKKLEVVESV